MSKQNKVNPGMYTQRGRLTQDDAARELRKQRSIGSQHTWQPVKKNAMPQLSPAANNGRATETSEDNESNDETLPVVEALPASRVTKKKTAKKAAAKSAPVKVKAKAAKKSPRTKTVQAKKTISKPKAREAAKTVAKRTQAKPKRKAVLARNVGGGGAAPRPIKKR